MASHPLAPSESTPLLQADEANRDEDSLDPPSVDLSDASYLMLDERESVDSQSSASPPAVNYPLFPLVPILCGLLSIVADLGGGLTTAPEVRLLEMPSVETTTSSTIPQ